MDTNTCNAVVSLHLSGNCENQQNFIVKIKYPKNILQALEYLNIYAAEKVFLGQAY